MTDTIRLAARTARWFDRRLVGRVFWHVCVARQLREVSQGLARNRYFQSAWGLIVARLGKTKIALKSCEKRIDRTDRNTREYFEWAEKELLKRV